MNEIKSFYFDLPHRIGELLFQHEFRIMHDQTLDKWYGDEISCGSWRELSTTEIMELTRRFDLYSKL